MVVFYILPYMQVRYRNFDSRRCFGIELEASPTLRQSTVQAAIAAISANSVRVTDWAQSYNNNYWHIKEDSTCGPNYIFSETRPRKDYGLEIASFKASGITQLDHIADVVNHLQYIGLETNRNCGFHIHGEILDYGPARAGVLLARWIKLEPIFCCLAEAHRVNNVHCRLWSQDRRFNLEHEYNALNLWHLLAPRNLAHSNNPDKRMSLNFTNFSTALYNESVGLPANRKTAELRLPESCLNGKEVANWVMLFLLFLDSSANATMPVNLQPITCLESFFQYLGLSSENEFVILDKTLFKLKCWVLNKIINSRWVRMHYDWGHYAYRAEQKLKNICSPK